jgi:membrane protease subunit HflK
MAQGDIASFGEIWKEYKDAKDVTRRRMYLETMEYVLPKAGSIYIFEPDATNVLPLLKLNEGVK